MPMLATLIIVFREVFEAGLIIGIILAATRGVPNRTRWVSYGILGGVFGACLVAAFAGSIAGALSGSGQELFNASMMFVAVLMLGWHNVWMAKHGRIMAKEMKAIGQAVGDGRNTLAALSVVVGVAVLREGSEVVLFLYGIAVSGTHTAASMLGGGLLGLALGAGVTALMHLGMVRIPTRRLFSVTEGLITLIAAGMASQGVMFLQQAGIITGLSQTMWDTSALLSDASLIGKCLHTLIGYTDQPTAAQLLVYALTLIGIVTFMRLGSERNGPSRTISGQPA